MKAQEKQSPAPAVTKGQIVDVDIDGLGHDGEGVGRVQGFALFMPGAIPGDRVRACITETRKNFGRGVVLEVLQPSTDRVIPECPVSQRCGGCALLHMQYDAQLRWKRQQVADALRRIGGLGEVPVRPVIGMSLPGAYRNKGQYPVGRVEGDQPALVTGFYSRGTHEIVGFDGCLIQHPLNNRVVAEARAIAADMGLSAYDEATGRGFLRHILVRVGRATGQAMCTLVTNEEEFPGASDFGRRLHEAVPEVISVVQNVNTRRTNIIMGDVTRVIWGKETIEDRIDELRFQISARSFYQVNPEQTEVLYRTALDYAALDGDECVLDLYCGIGTISLFLARRAATVFGVEYVEEAVEDARRNAELNGMTNVEFRAGDASEVLVDLGGEGVRFDVAVLDPPRAGCDAGVIRALASMHVPRIVYVSCNPASLARDLALLTALGYAVREVQPVDMFPHTSHVEAVALVTRK